MAYALKVSCQEISVHLKLVINIIHDHECICVLCHVMTTIDCNYLAMQEVIKSDVDMSQLLEPLLEDAAEQLFNWPDEGSLPVLSMHVSVQAKELAQDAAQPLPFEADADVEDDGVLPNQQVIAQELLTRVLIMTGASNTIDSCASKSI